ncbi:MAG: peptidoglycan binding domain-containing protein, partial [Dehalococcoidales bacterium]|nr:peptidoglycan binding domain-containing protein [Dehalococcoidales bacterium]
MAFLIIAPIVTYQVVYANHVYLGVKSMGVDIGGYTADEVTAALSAHFANYARTPLVFKYDKKEWRTTPGAVGIRFDGQATARKALDLGRTGSLLDNLGGQLAMLRSGRSINPVLTIDHDRQSAVISNLSREIDRPMINASLVIGSDGAVTMVSSQVGRKLDTEETLRRVEKALGEMSSAPIDLAVTETPPRVVDSQLAAAKDSAERILSAPMTIAYENERVELDRAKLASMLAFRDDGGETVAELDPKELQTIISQMAERIDREPRDAKFVFKNQAVQIATESQDGRTVDVAASVDAVRGRSLGGDRAVELTVQVVPPKVRSSDINSIVMSDKVVEASTKYGDTGLDRQYNVRLAVS